MKLNRPKVTQAQSILEDYVAVLLKDCSKDITQLKPTTSSKEHSTKERNTETQIEMPTVERVERTKVAEQFNAEKKTSFQQQIDPRLKSVEKLLAKISLANVTQAISRTNESPEKKTRLSNINETDLNTQTSLAPATEISQESAQASFSLREKDSLKNTLGEVFQTLVFEVNKLLLAVPLVKLGGIVNLNQGDITPLVGTPNWFMGLLPNERGNLMVVDTQKFLMPERTHNFERDYDFLIVLDDSLWALACHTVGDAKNLSPDDIRWSSGSSKRPWFAGMVVEYMSALVEVDKLINMLTENIVD